MYTATLRGPTWSRDERAVINAFEAMRAQTERRLRSLDCAPSLVSLAGLPSNRLKVLHGDRQGQHSIRINDQWRVCFM